MTLCCCCLLVIFLSPFFQLLHKTLLAFWTFPSSLSPSLAGCWLKVSLLHDRISLAFSNKLLGSASRHGMLLVCMMETRTWKTSSCEIKNFYFIHAVMLWEASTAYFWILHHQPSIVELCDEERMNLSPRVLLLAVIFIPLYELITCSREEEYVCKERSSEDVKKLVEWQKRTFLSLSLIFQSEI